MSQEVYAISNLEGYAHQIREASAKNLSENSSNDDLNEFISIGQIINMIKNECLGFDSMDRPLLDEITNEKIFENVTVWIHNVGLAKLAAKDLVECAWDNENNEMIFWAKEKIKSNDKPKSGRKNKKSQG